jgi:hypothetical protein
MTREKSHIGPVLRTQPNYKKIFFLCAYSCWCWNFNLFCLKYFLPRCIWWFVFVFEPTPYICTVNPGQDQNLINNLYLYSSWSGGSPPWQQCPVCRSLSQETKLQQHRTFKGTVPRDVLLQVFFHELISPKALSIPLAPFRIFEKSKWF